MIMILGIRECEVIQWFVEPGARVEEFAKLCEVQSDKASVEITSRFTGVIKKLHYEAGEMAIVGKPLVDIDIQGEIDEKELEALTASTEGEESASQSSGTGTDIGLSQEIPKVSENEPRPISTKQEGKYAGLATPAVRHLLKELGVAIQDVTGTGKDGRVMKEDVYKFAESRNATGSSTSRKTPITSESQTETIIPLRNVQQQMFKTMTRSLTIPHFLYADEIDFSALSLLRYRINGTLSKTPIEGINKLSYLPFVIKAVSLALDKYPILNARVDNSDTAKPSLIMRSQHNIGIAIDTPQGLLVPVIKNVSALSVLDIAIEAKRLQLVAAAGKLTSQDLSGGTITVSNIGSIGGTYVSPVIVDTQVAILGLGKTRTVPAFDETGVVIRKDICNFSWSADHRVVDGATMARVAEVLRKFVEEPDSMIIHLR